ncbi:hypothetical protein [Streptomyces cavourensis]|uniref:hypothetical protein n=1 Tax=Streptomyces cavourensis TaxID=67258 RepID=UPI000DC65B68|nr:hypothetical protein [Streptomyces cavourensis]ATY97213.1 hypothetical protein CVT27_18485 [Streptomyces cavourensis]
MNAHSQEPGPPAGRPLSTAEASAEAARLIHEAYRQDTPPPTPTSYRDTTPLPVIGTAAPVTQPDSRIVPQWAAGVAVASIGVGAGITGLGCGAWLALQGLASVTLTGVLAGTLPFAALAAVITAAGTAIARARAASTTHIYKGTVIKRTEVTSTARGLLSRSHVGH